MPPTGYRKQQDGSWFKPQPGQPVPPLARGRRVASPAAAGLRPPVAPGVGALLDGMLAPPEAPVVQAAAVPPQPAGDVAAGAAQPVAPLVVQPPQAAGAVRAARVGPVALLRVGLAAARWCMKAPGRGVTWAAVAAMLLGWCYLSAPITHVGTMLGVAARMTVSAGNVVDSGLSAVVTAAQGVSDVALASSKKSASLLEEAWRGVDLAN